MELRYVIFCYFVLVFVMFLVCSYYRITFVGALVIAILVGFFFLNVARSPDNVDEELEVDSSYVVYCFIQFFSVILVFIYALCVACNSRCCVSQPACGQH